MGKPTSTDLQLGLATAPVLYASDKVVSTVDDAVLLVVRAIISFLLIYEN